MKDAIRLLTQVLATQAGQQNRSHEYPDRAASARARDFLTLNPPEFKGTDPNADPQEFIDGLESELQEMCMPVAMQPGIDIARIQAYAQGAEDRKRQREAISEQGGSQPKRARTEGRSKGSTSESRPQYSAPSPVSRTSPE
ncbi:uncharacterized protein LOC132042578 [Lycium ferocissimum]|uniref:uncharacterized protein LOC132042578 n=1 Tax=Lycium ferocissimum TaxID=112874 RepID=UPI002815B877|nr:uncharacterized protein LOC132042578 [Lycium ferocissimum]